MTGADGTDEAPGHGADEAPRADLVPADAVAEAPSTAGTSPAAADPGGSGGDGGAPAAAGEPAVMSLVDHLAELRDRLVRSVLAILAGAIIGFLVGDRVVEILRAPLPPDVPIVVTGIGDAFAIRLRISLVIGIILAMPVLLYQLWAFIAPGLTEAERRAIRPWIPLSLVFFALGCTIAYIVLPFAAQFLLAFTSDVFEPLLDVRQYFDFVTTMFLAFGLIMEFPILLVGLSRVGVLTSARLRGARRYVILGIAIFAASVTPGGDLVSPGALGLTMYVLFEITVAMIARSGR